ncbi:DUF4355 domain-containing protein [Peribacillus frigoritolerans]|uniref:DUF4355 domain-containing protein n=1 Tax=Peribacillus frigoritolerans TaxID=450367 RepID=UPI002282A495|nr:DUF4355 domain-containing protein [Peribacillus frigoritolerans]MCY9007186.1 DUF4355 domain-containing protein [Peribacillus frigoritolerans]
MEFFKHVHTPDLPLKLDMQFFAEGENEGADLNNEEGQQPTTITLTQEELTLKLQQEADRRVTEAQKKWEAKTTQELETRIQQEREEAEKLAKLSQEERFKVERDKELAKIEEDRKSFEAERLQFNQEKLFTETEKVLISESLPSSFASFLISDTAETTNENIQAFKSAFNEAVQVAANAALPGRPPVAGSGKQLSELDQLNKQHQEAVQAKNMPLAISLKNKIHELQK